MAFHCGLFGNDDRSLDDVKDLCRSRISQIVTLNINIRYFTVDETKSRHCQLGISLLKLVLSTKRSFWVNSPCNASVNGSHSFSLSESAHKCHSRAETHKEMLIGLIFKFVINEDGFFMSQRCRWRRCSAIERPHNHNVLSKLPSIASITRRYKKYLTPLLPQRGLWMQSHQTKDCFFSTAASGEISSLSYLNHCFKIKNSAIKLKK